MRGVGRGRLSGSLSVQLGLAVAIGLCVASLLTMSGLALRALDSQTRQQTAELRSIARMLSSNVATDLLADDLGVVSQTLRAIRYAPNVARVAILDAHGNILVEETNPVPEQTGRAAFSAIEWVLRRTLGTRVQERLAILHEGAPVGILSIEAQPRDPAAPFRHEFAQASVWALVSLFAGILIAQFQQRRLVRPILRLSERMSEVAPGRPIPAPVTVEGGGEIAVLGRSYNTMIAAIAARDREIARHRDQLEEQVERRTAELRLARDDAEAATEAKSRFLATMSHEIRTPMNGVLAMAELLARSDLPTAERGYAQIIVRSGRSLLDILNDSLDLSKLEAGRLRLEAIPVDPDALAVDAVALFSQQARAKGIGLTGGVACCVPAQFRGDPARLRQCLNNLVGNAVKFTATGHVRLWIDLDTAPDGDKRLVLSVRDTGPGIAPDRQSTIFEPFEQEDQSTTRRHGGTGLGLAIVRQLVEQMGGEIQLDSTPDQGSRFTICLPCDTVEPAPAPCLPPLTLALGALDRPVAELLQRSLEGLGVDISASDKAQACLIPTDAPQEPHGPPAIGVWPLGEAEPRAALTAGRVQDLLPVPFRREELIELLKRIASDSLRGATALAGEAPRIAAREDFSGLRVLVADDAEVNQQVFRDALAAMGVKPTLVADGAQAVAAVERQRFDLVLLDGSMPRMDGSEAARAIRRIEAGRDARGAMLVLATAQVSIAGALDWRDAGFDAHLGKPLSMEALAAVLGAASERASNARSGTSADAGSLLDETVLEMLHALDLRRPGAFKRIASEFEATVGPACSRLQAALAAGDAETARRAAHALKSIAGSGGARRLAEIAADLEHIAAEDAAAGVPLRQTGTDAETLERIATASRDALTKAATATASGQGRTMVRASP